ncbi:MAG: secondary thiamine-phosphate synthase enzyme YjbQ, partial [Candidatus Dormibacteraeota bacterium]|nr:secondary thiamine-phosphate synthase enzyme YjbQ [Candidatus Dormibacteraeota bacterium]
MIGKRLDFETKHATEFVDITDRLRDEVQQAGLRMGRLHLQSLHTTLGLAVNENEPLLLRDFQGLLERLAPQGAGYQHDDFARRFDVALDEPINGHAHCRQLLLTGFATVLVEDGELVLGRWQSVFAVELDGPRHRQLAVQLDGEFGALLPTRNGRVNSEALVELELTRQLLVDPEPVAAPMRRLVEAGGKRLRPKLVQLTAEIGPRSDPLRAAALAAAVELLHNATLIHDDYVDESTHRRGRPTVAAAEGPERAVAVGDYYFAKGTRLIAEIGDRNVTSTFAEALEAICAAQIDDVALRGTYPGSHDSYMRVVRGKTAALFAAACASGAQLSEASPEIVNALFRYGDLLGVAFQMADDMVDFSSSSGKPVGLDIRQRVLSLPLIYAAEDRAVGPEVRRLLAGSLGDAEVRRVAELVMSTDALHRVRGEAVALVDAAVHELENVELDGLRPVLINLAHSAVDRDS